MQSYNEQIKDNHNTRQQTQQDKQNKHIHNTQPNERTQTNTIIQHNKLYKHIIDEYNQHTINT